jgi:uncharacterized protein (TIRG00374 family)
MQQPISAQPKAKKGRLSLALRLVLSAGLIAFLCYTVDVRSMGAILAESNPWLLLLAFAVAMADRVLMTYKWVFLLRPKGIRIPLLPLTGMYLTSTFLGLFLPATVGADALRAYTVSKRGYRLSDLISSIVVERVLGVAALLACVLISIALSVFVFGQSFFGGIWSLFWIITGSLALIAAGLLLSVNRRVTGTVGRFVTRRGLGTRGTKVAAKLQEIHHSYASYGTAKPAVAAFLALSMLENMLPVLMNYFIAQALNIDVSLLYFLILTPIVLVLVRLPISLDGIGIHQGTFVYFLGLIGVGGSEALASHLMAIISVLPGGLLYALGGLGSREALRPAGPEPAIEIQEAGQQAQ